MGLKISFIVPVFNVEKYLSQCIDSIIEQNYNNLEVILINDGSSDSSPIICDEYVKKDNRIKVIHRSNQGPSSARNFGIEIATGDYVCFLDSDDFWENAKLEDIMDSLRKSQSDMMVIPIVSYFEEQNEYRPFSQKIENINNKKNGKEYLCEILKKEYTFGWCPIRYIINRKILGDSLRFIEGYLCEDVDFVFRLWNSVSSVDFYNEDVYIYRRENSNSITHIASFKFSVDLLFMIKQNLENASKYNTQRELRNLLYLNFQDLLSVVLFWYSSYTFKEKRILKKKIHEVKYVFDLDEEFKIYASPKVRIVRFIIATFGVELTGLLWGFKRKLLKKN